MQSGLNRNDATEVQTPGKAWSTFHAFRPVPADCWMRLDVGSFSGFSEVHFITPQIHDSKLLLRRSSGLWHPQCWSCSQLRADYSALIEPRESCHEDEFTRWGISKNDIAPLPAPRHCA